MTWHWPPFAIVLFVSGIISTGTAFYILWRRRHRKASVTGALVLLAAAIWMLAYALEIGSINLSTKIFWDKVQYVGICFVPTGWLIYTLQHTGRQEWLTGRNLALLSIVPLATFLLAFTNEAHGLIRSAYVLDARGLSLERETYQPALWIYIAYAYLVTMGGMVFLIQAFLRSGRLYRWQASALVFAVFTPWLVSGGSLIFGVNPFPNLELTPLAIGLTTPIVAWILFRLRRLDIMPVARSTVFESLQDAVLVLDAQNRIIDLNPAAQDLIDHPFEQAVGQPVHRLWPAIGVPHRGAKAQREVVVRQKDGQRVYDMRISRLKDWRGHLVSQVVVLRDITPLRRRTMELSTLLRATKALSSTLDLEEVLALIAEQMVKAIGVDGCTLSRWDQERDAVVTWIEHRRQDWELADQPGNTYALDDFPMTRSVLDTGVPHMVCISDTSADPAEVAYMRKVGSASLLMLPLVLGGQTFGLVELDQSEYERHFSAEEIRLCQALADQAGVAIENARLYQQSRQSLQELTDLLQIGIGISSSLDSQEIIDAVAREAVRLLKTTSAYVCRWDDEEQVATVLAEYYSPEASPRERISDLGVSYAEDRYTTELLRKRQSHTMRLADPHLPPDWREHFEEYDAKSSLFLPLVSLRGTMAYLEIWESRYDRVFTENEVLLGLNLASQAAVALDNARLHAETTQRLREQIALRESGAIISSALNLETVLTRIAEQMSQAIDATSAYICSYDPDTKMAKVIAEYIGPQACPEERGSDLGSTYVEDDPVFERILLEGGHDISYVDAANITETERAHMQEYRAQTILYIPLRIKDQPIGYVELWDSRRPREFTPQEIDLCENISQQAAIALENARLYQQAQEEISERLRAEEQLKTSLGEKEVLLKEIHHRVKNNLQVISSMLNLQSGYVENQAAKTIFQESQNRIQSMALIHEKLYRSENLAQIDFAEYVRDLAAYLSSSHNANARGITLTVEADEIPLGIDSAVPCGLILNELVSNALKHAFSSSQTTLPDRGRNGDNESVGDEIRIKLSTDEARQLSVVVSDNGIGFPKNLDFQNTASLGLRLVNTLVEQLEGSIELNGDQGTEFRIRFVEP